MEVIYLPRGIKGHRIEARMFGVTRVVVYDDSTYGMHKLLDEFAAWMNEKRRELEAEADRKLMELVDNIFRGHSSVVNRGDGGFMIDIYGVDRVRARVIGMGSPEDPKDVRVEG